MLLIGRMVLYWLPAAFGAAPADFDALLALAVSRDPGAAADVADAEAARWRAASARTPMNPQLMVGVDALGAPMGAADPTMGMVGASQMLQGWGQARAAAARQEVERARSEVDRDRLAADLRLQLAQAVARIREEKADLALLDEQGRQIELLRLSARARWGAGAPSPLPAPASTGPGMEEGPSTAPPREGRARAAGGTGGMAGMGGMSGMPGTGGRSGTAPPAGPMSMDDGGSMGTMGPMVGMSSMNGGMGGGPLVEQLRLDTEAATLAADRAAVDARLRGEVDRLALFVGEEAASAVHDRPDAYRPAATSGDVPELRLAELDRAAAAADVVAARSQLWPDLMLAVGERVMPDGMVGGTDLSVGIELPFWGGHRRELAAARASASAADLRAEALVRDVEAARTAARAAEAAAEARRDVLECVAVPSARAAFEAATARWSAGAGSVDEVLRTWEARLDTERQLLEATRDRDLRAAERARLEAR